MNRLKRILTGAITASMMSIILSFQVFGARIAFSDPSVESGNEVTVNMKISGAGGETINSSNVMLSYDPSSLQFISGTGATGEAGAIRVVGESQSGDSTELTFALTFRALKPGSTKVSVSTQEVYDKNGQIVNISQEGNSTITISGEEAAVSGALSDLQISPGMLSPAFSPDIENYTAVVGVDVSQITVNAPAQDGSCSVAISGNEDLQIGDNEIVCTVTAPDGQAIRTYRIVVTKVEGEVGESIVDRVALKTDERTLTVISAQEGMDIPSGFVRCTVSIDGQPVQGWTWGADENPEYCIFYAINEKGEEGFYRYDLTEKTSQRYFRDPTGGEFEGDYNVIAEEYNSLLKDYEVRFWIIIGLIALSVVLLIVIIVLVAGRGQRDDFIEKKESEDGWENRRNRNNRTTKEEYLRGTEEESKRQEEDYSFSRRVQDNMDDRSYVVRGGYGGQAQAGNPGETRGGFQENYGNGTGIPPARETAQKGFYTGARGTDFSGGTGGFRESSSTGYQGMGTGSALGYGNNFSEEFQENRRTAPAEETKTVSSSQLRGSQMTNPAGLRGNASGGRVENFYASGDARPRGGNIQESVDTGTDDDFEVFDLK